MAYERYIAVYDGLAGSLKWTDTIGSSSLLLQGSAFELTRYGGCGAGNLSFAVQGSYGKFELGDLVKIGYDADNLWYQGVVTRRKKGSVLQVGLTGYGHWRYSGVKPNDTKTSQTVDQIVNQLHTTYVDPVEGSNLEISTASTSLASIVFDGEQPLPDTLTKWSRAFNSSWAISGDESGGERTFYFVQDADLSGSDYEITEGTDFSWISHEETLDGSYTQAIVRAGEIGEIRQESAAKVVGGLTHFAKVKKIHFNEARTSATATAIAGVYGGVLGEVIEKESLDEPVRVPRASITATSVPFPWLNKIKINRRSGEELFTTRLNTIKVELGGEGLSMSIGITNDEDDSDLESLVKDIAEQVMDRVDPTDIPDYFYPLLEIIDDWADYITDPYEDWNALADAVINGAGGDHTHLLVAGATDVETTEAKIDAALENASANVTSTNLNTLTAGSTSNASGLHTHNLRVV